MAGNIIQQEITEYYSGYMAMSMARLALWTFLITLYLFSMGVFLYLFLSKAKGYRYKWYYAALFGAATFGSISALQFLKALYFIPSSIVASFHYRISRLYPLLDSISVSVLKYITDRHDFYCSCLSHLHNNKILPTPQLEIPENINCCCFCIQHSSITEL